MPNPPDFEQTLLSAIGNREGMEETGFGTAVFAHHRTWRGGESGEPWGGWCSFTHYSFALGTDYRCLRFAWTRSFHAWLQGMRGPTVWSLGDLIHPGSHWLTVPQKLFAQFRIPPSFGQKYDLRLTLKAAWHLCLRSEKLLSFRFGPHCGCLAGLSSSVVWLP